MYIQLTLSFVIFSQLTESYGLASYDQFQGFETTESLYQEMKSGLATADSFFLPYYGNEKAFEASKKNRKKEDITRIPRQYKTEPKSVSAPVFTLNCPEHELPSNIGPYEVPTQEDLALMMKTMLMDILDRYKRKAMYLLQDIKQATRSTTDIEKRCINKAKYKMCVKTISHKIQFITKAIATSIEERRRNVTAFSGEILCNTTASEVNPLELIQLLAMEEASLEFALPGFLRLLNKCYSYCHSNFAMSKHKKPKARRLTDQDLVIKHFLTRKNYMQLVDL